MALTVAALSMTVLAVVGCSSSSTKHPGAAGTGTSGGSSTTSTPGATVTTIPGAKVEGTFPPNTATINTSSSVLGAILVDGTGHTLYAYAGDGDRGVPTCLSDCAAAWPPVTGSLLGVASAIPVSPHEFTLVLIPGTSTKQVVVNGHPLYRFSGDALAGDVKGQGLGGQWHVVGPDGNPITKPAPPSTTSTTG